MYGGCEMEFEVVGGAAYTRTFVLSYALDELRVTLLKDARLGEQDNLSELCPVLD